MAMKKILLPVILITGIYIVVVKVAMSVSFVVSVIYINDNSVVYKYLNSSKYVVLIL